MPNALKTPQPGTDPLSTDVGQFALLLQGLLDAGILQLTGPQSTPTAPSAVASGNSGNLNGAYRWIVVLITGWKQGDNSYYVSGFAPSTDSVQVTITNNSANLSSIATGTSVVIGRAIYRTAAGGAAGTEKFAFVIWDNTTTTWTDNVSDANLGTGMPGSGSSLAAYGTAIPASVPTSNTTGTSLSGTINATTGNVLRTDAGAPNPQTITNGVTFRTDVNFDNGSTDTSGAHWVDDTNNTDVMLDMINNGTVRFTAWHGTKGGSATGQPLAFDASTNKLYSQHNTLDDGSGNATFTGNVTANGKQAVTFAGNIEFTVATLVSNPANQNSGLITYGYQIASIPESDVLINNVSSNVSYFLEVTAWPATANNGGDVQLWDVIAGAAVANTDITVSSSATQTSPMTVRTSAISLVAGHKYQLYSANNSSFYNLVSEARIVGVI